MISIRIWCVYNFFYPFVFYFFFFAGFNVISRWNLIHVKRWLKVLLNTRARDYSEKSRRRKEKNKKKKKFISDQNWKRERTKLEIAGECIGSIGSRAMTERENYRWIGFGQGQSFIRDPIESVHPCLIKGEPSVPLNVTLSFSLFYHLIFFQPCTCYFHLQVRNYYYLFIHLFFFHCHYCFIIILQLKHFLKILTIFDTCKKY